MIQFLLARPPDLLGFVLAATILLAAVVVHEFTHTFVALSMGDPTAKLAGRLTFNPRSHLDVFGSFAIFLLGFGWGKPVPFSPPKLGGGKLGPVVVASAGPLANLLMALTAGAAMAVVRPSPFSAGGDFLRMAFYLNVVYAIFNLLPIPPLDGFPILTALLPASKSNIIFFIERWAFLLVLAVAFVLFEPFVLPLAQGFGLALLRLMTL